MSLLSSPLCPWDAEAAVEEVAASMATVAAPFFGVVELVVVVDAIDMPFDSPLLVVFVTVVEAVAALVVVVVVVVVVEEVVVVPFFLVRCLGRRLCDVSDDPSNPSLLVLLPAPPFLPLLAFRLLVRRAMMAQCKD